MTLPLEIPLDPIWRDLWWVFHIFKKILYGRNTLRKRFYHTISPSVIIQSALSIMAHSHVEEVGWVTHSGIKSREHVEPLTIFVFFNLREVTHISKLLSCLRLQVQC